MGLGAGLGCYNLRENQLATVILQYYIVEMQGKKLKLFDSDQQEPEIATKPSGKKEKPKQPEQTESKQQEPKRWEDFSLKPQLIKCLKSMEYVTPSAIQSQSLPFSLQHRDLLCLSQTGSGKTLSFLLPIINSLLEMQQFPQGYALIISPTRQLSLQTKTYFDRMQKHGVSIPNVCIYGGTNTMKQVIELTKNPSVIIATPGAILNHLQNTKGFNLDHLKYFVLDEADKLLNMDFQKQINEILELIPKQRITYLFSATLTSKVHKLQRVSLKNPEKIELSEKYQTVEQLQQYYLFFPAKFKDLYLVYLLLKHKDLSSIVFVRTCLNVVRIASLLKQLGYNVTCLHGELSQSVREANLQKFRSKTRKVLISTDVSSRGIDISGVELVINYDIPTPKDYIHRVGRTARMGSQGLALTFVTQYDVEQYQKIQSCLERKLEEYKIEEKEVLLFQQKVEATQRQVSRKLRSLTNNKVNLEDQ